MKYCYTILFLCLITVSTFAQSSKGKITGKVTDATTKLPVDYATIGLFPQGTTKPITGAAADGKGGFTLVNIPNGEYQLTVNFIGYKQVSIDHIVISDSKNNINLNTILLQSASKQLNAVSVTAKTPVIENKIDKLVYNAANDITSQGGIALDVLKKVPQVNVDIDGNVELQGNSNIRFLINGKPSSVFGASVADALAAIPASQIKSIEVITSPGAKYDAEGTGGIINIILKDNKVQGINGNINLSAGTRLENGSANFNVRHNNFGIGLFLSGNAQVNTRGNNSQDQVSTNATGDSLFHRKQNGNSDLHRNGYQSGLSFDWNITPKDNITATLGYNRFGNNNEGMTGQEDLITSLAGVPLSSRLSNRASASKFNAHSFDYSINYRKKFKQDGQELSFLYTSSLGNNRSQYSQEQFRSGKATAFSGANSNSPGSENETEIQLDYTQPVTKNLIIETGVKTVLQTIRSSANVFTLDSLTQQYGFDARQSYDLYYNRKVYAGYLSATFSVFNFFDVKAGARFERTNTTIDFPNTSIPSYNTLVPSAVISHSFKNAQTVKLSFTRRIERPDFRELNPFQNLSDPYNITTGNPLLQSEFGNNAELGYNKSFEKGGNINVAFVVRYNTNDLKPYTVNYPQYTVGDSVYRNVNVSTRVNVGQELNTGMNISGSMPVGEKLNFRTNIYVSNRHIVNELDPNNRVVDGLGYRINMNGTYQLPKDLIMELFGNYQSAFNNVQGRNPHFISYNFAFRKQLFNKKASFGFTTTNPFSQYVNQVSTVRGSNFTTYNIRQVPYRSFGVSLTYKFGKLEFKKDKQNDNLPTPIDN
ncbi:MAG: outer membrane beta-barrel protein [Bacteroidota bacterium]